MTKQIRFAPIIRVSTKSQEEAGESLKTQTAQIIQYVKVLGGVIPKGCWKYKGQESATSGKERKRLDSLLEDSARGLFDAVIVVDPSRWSRDNQKSEEGLEILRQNGIRFFVAGQEYDLFDPTQCFILTTITSINQYTVDIGSLKSIQNRIARAKRGVPTSGKIPYGREYNKKTETWSIDPEKQKIIQEAARRYIQGENIKVIALDLGFNRSTLYTILTAQCGREFPVRFRMKKFRIDEEVVIPIPELLDPDTIHKIHERVRVNTNIRRSGKKWFFALSGFVFCRNCGVRYNVYKNQRNLRYYRHRKVKSNGDCEVGKVIPADILEEKVLRHLIRTFGDPEKIRRSIERGIPDRKRLDDLESTQGEIRERMTKLKRQKGKILDLLDEEDFDEADFKDRLLKLKEKEDAMSERLKVIEAELASIPDLKEVRKTSYWAGKVIANASKDPELLKYKTDEWKRKLIESAFSGQDPTGRPLGVYMEWIRGEWQYQIRGRVGGVIGTLTNDEEQINVYSNPISSHKKDYNFELNGTLNHLIA